MLVRAAATVRGAAIAHRFFIEVSRNGETLHKREEFDEPVELGRQEQLKGEEAEPLFRKLRRDGTTRFVIARGKEETYVHRHHLRIESTGPDTVRLTNVGGQNGVRVLDHAFLLPQQSGEYHLPIQVQLKDLSVKILTEDQTSFESLSYRSVAPGMMRTRITPNVRSSLVVFDQPSAENLGRWMEAILEVLQSPIGQQQFYEQAARALVELAGLDRGAVLEKTADGWKTLVCHPPLPADDSWTPSKSMLAAMESAVTAISETINQSQDLNASIAGVRQVLAAPILGRDDRIRGALYGDRRSERRGAAVGASQYDLMAVKLLAGGVANGIARLEVESEAKKARDLLAGFFTQDLADELSRNPDMLKGRNTEVTLLFCDVRGFSSITERLGPQVLMDWINSVLTTLSKCVIDEGGVPVDFIGDEIFAMFGAPKGQADHARRACRAAMAMLRATTEIDKQWLDVVGQPTQFSIGVSSGVTRVGNTGSEQRFKYGALGRDVNLASRVQGASKYLRTDLIVTDSTMRLLGDEFPSRRLCQVQVINIDQPIGVYEIFVNPPENWQELKTRYEEALQLFEVGNFRQSSKVLGRLFSMFAEDGPSLQLLSRAVTCLVDPDADCNPVWRLPGK